MIAASAISLAPAPFTSKASVARRERPARLTLACGLSKSRTEKVTAGPEAARPRLPQACVALIATAATASLLFGPMPVEASSIFEGQYSDPKHPGCLRKVESNGIVSGTDGTPGCQNGEPQRPWELKGFIDEEGKQIFIDFSPKGGPKDLTGLWTGSGIRFPDGNTWKKLQ